MNDTKMRQGNYWQRNGGVDGSVGDGAVRTEVGSAIAMFTANK